MAKIKMCALSQANVCFVFFVAVNVGQKISRDLKS